MQQDCPLSCPFLPVAASYRKLSMQRHVSKLGNLLQFGSSKRNDAKKILSVLPGDNVKTYVAGKYLFTFLVLSASHPGLPRHVHHDRIVNILRLFPKAAMTCDTEGTTPLHYVLRELRDARADMDIVYALLEAFPPAAFQQNSLGETPLHQLISSSPRDRPIDLAVMKAIVHSCPSSVRCVAKNTENLY